ncbi:MAG: FtsX-like permease family protein [Chitinophagaceae bacterium]|nr:MAG: FtsX-like permease family protein [Chitinophagaceae bacterium]
MFTSFFRIAWRNMIRAKGFTVINITGLIVGMASAILIMLWITNEVSFDRFHARKDRIYEAWNKAVFSGEMNTWNTTPQILARTLEKDLPEVETAVRVDWTQNSLLTIGEQRMTIPGNVVDSNFLEVFSFPMVKGNMKSALDNTFSIVLTEKLARKLFGREDPMGKIVRVDETDNFTVTGVVADLPNNTRFDFEYLIPWAYKHYRNDDDENWGNNSTRTYVLLKENASLASANAQMKLLKPRYDKTEPKWEMFLYPMDRWHLYSSFDNGVEDGGGRITFVRMFGIVAAFILLIACINFMNLSTARSEKRAKEVGIRKVVGAQRHTLIGQFIGESTLLSFIACVFAVLLVQVVLRPFNGLTDKQLAIPYGDWSFWLYVLGFILLTGLLAGSYPAFFLSSFQPVKVLKGTFRRSQAVFNPRKILVVLQFTFAIVLIICTIIVKQQIGHAQDRQSGYDKNNLVYHVFTGDIGKNYELIKNELLTTGVAAYVTKTSSPITQSWSDGWGQEWEGKDPNDKTDFFRFNADDGLGKTAGLEFLQGRDFDLRRFPTDSTGMIINESALKVVKFKEPIGKVIKDNGTDWHIVGVIKDFILTNPYAPTRPMLIAGGKAWFSTIMIRFNSANGTASNIASAEKIFKQYNPKYPFDYKFVDEEYARKFNAEARIGTLAALFAGLTIFISCLGLFGLAIFMAETRIREIGVRKVLGASVSGLVALLSKDFLRLVLIAFILATPIAWWAMHSWLSDYQYRVAIQWWVFAGAGLVSLLIALATVSFQAIRAALMNPVKSLRSE